MKSICRTAEDSNAAELRAARAINLSSLITLIRAWSKPEEISFMRSTTRHNSTDSTVRGQELRRSYGIIISSLINAGAAANRFMAEKSRVYPESSGIAEIPRIFPLSGASNPRLPSKFTTVLPVRRLSVIVRVAVHYNLRLARLYFPGALAMKPKGRMQRRANSFQAAEPLVQYSAGRLVYRYRTPKGVKLMVRGEMQ